MSSFIFKSFVSVFILFGLVSTLSPSQAGQSSRKPQQQEEEPYPGQFATLPKEINQSIFKSLRLKDIWHTRFVSREWYAVMSAKALDFINEAPQNLSVYDTESALHASTFFDEFRRIVHCFPDHYPTLFQTYTTLNPCKDFKMITLAAFVLESPKFKRFFQENLGLIEVDVFTKFNVNETKFFIKLGQQHSLYPQLQQYLMGLKLLARNNDEEAEQKRHSFSVAFKQALDVFNAGLRKEDNKVVTNKQMKKILKQNKHLLRSPCWVAYVAFKSHVPSQQATILCTLMNSELKEKLDIESVSLFCDYFVNTFSNDSMFSMALIKGMAKINPLTSNHAVPEEPSVTSETTNRKKNKKEKIEKQ